MNTTIEMPEGAVMSDNDDKNDLDVNDPHRALDINLEADDDFYAPPKSSKSKIVNEPEPAKLKEKSHRKKNEAEPVLLMESEENHKKEKKKHKRKKEEKEVKEVNLFSEVPSSDKKEKKSKKKSNDVEKPKKSKKSSTKKSEYEEAFGQVM